MQNESFHAIVVGKESIHNLRLSDLLRKTLGERQVLRLLEIRHLLEYLAENDSIPIGIFFDLFCFDIAESTNTINYVRNQYPVAVFCLHLSDLEYRRRWHELPTDWQFRLDHYYRLFKESMDTELEPIVRKVLRYLTNESSQNLEGNFIRFTEASQESQSLYMSKDSSKSSNDKNRIFISYSRRDWDDFVLPLTNRLRDKGYSIWIDQHLLAGGDDWMDSIGEALDECKLLLLIMSPDSIESRFVKMEYRYFFTADKTFIPLLYRHVEKIPPELAITQYIDFTQSDNNPAFAQLIDVIDAKLK